MVAQGGAEGGTLGESTSIQRSPERATESGSDFLRPLQGSKLSEHLPRVPPSAPPWAILQRRFAAQKPLCEENCRSVQQIQAAVNTGTGMERKSCMRITRF